MVRVTSPAFEMSGLASAVAAGVAAFLSSSPPPGAAPRDQRRQRQRGKHAPCLHRSSFIAADGCRTGDVSPSSAPSSKSALNVTAPATAVATLTESDAYRTAQ